MKLSLSFAGALILACLAHASDPTSLCYKVTDFGGGIYFYEFTLTLDNNDSSWVAGQSWDWLVFGEAKYASSPLTGWFPDGDSFEGGPWTTFGYSFGEHTGPTLITVSTPWKPTFVGETVKFSGTSTANLVQGELLYSFLQFSPGANRPYFKEACQVVPEPVSMTALGLGVVITLRKRRS
ncbi:MAG: hypothetical protein ACOYON_08790 [Fimbriimonas sp.]